MSKITLLLMISSFSARIVLSCNNYEIIINKIDNCNKDNIITFDNFGFSLDKDCNIVPSGCIDTKGFNSAMVHWALTKTSMPPMDGDVDLCDTLKNNHQQDVRNILAALRLPNQCPVAKMRICGNSMKKVNIVKYKPLLPLLKGVTTVKANVVHDNGVTCTDIKITVQKIKHA